jgi:sulfate adenylyltransferase
MTLREPMDAPPWEGDVPDLLVREPEQRRALEVRALRAPSVVLGARALADLECLLTGAFTPLTGFLGPEDHATVLDRSRLADGRLWPIPVTLPVGEKPAAGGALALRGPEHELLAVLEHASPFRVDPKATALALWGPHADEHPLIREWEARGRWRVGGRVSGLRLPRPGPFAELRLPPAEVRRRLATLGHRHVVAFQTRNPLHRAHEWITKQAQTAVGGALLIHPTVGPTLPDDLEEALRVRAIQAVVAADYDPARVLLATVPLSMWLAGPREAVFHAIVRRTFGADHLIVGRDHAGPGRRRSGAPFYSPTASQEAVSAHAAETGVACVPFGEVLWLPGEGRFERAESVPPGVATAAISGSEVRARLAAGAALPSWFTRPETAALLAAATAPKGKSGVCVWFTGLPSSGKSTLARALTARLEETGRRVTLLDGDLVRALLSKGLGFSREDRDANVARLAYVAAEIVRHEGIAVVAAVSPYESARSAARQTVGADRFLLVHVTTPLSVCEARDPKASTRSHAAARPAASPGSTTPTSLRPLPT